MNHSNIQKSPVLHPFSLSSDNPKCLLQTKNKLLHWKCSSPLPSSAPGILRIALLLSSQMKYPRFVCLPVSTLLHHLHTHLLLLPHLKTFTSFTPASESELLKILSNGHNKPSNSDPTPTWILKECASVLASTITNSKHCQSLLRIRSVAPHSQRICHFFTAQETYLTKITERAVKYSLTSNKLLNFHKLMYMASYHIVLETVCLENSLRPKIQMRFSCSCFK